VAPSRVFLRHAPPASAKEHQRFFSAPIEWSAPVDGLRLDLSLLNAKSPQENPAMSRFFTAALERERASRDTVADRVRVALMRGLPSGPPSAIDLARSLGLSERSLRRALAEEQTSCRALLDDFRRTVAKDMLGEGKSVTEIAFTLGFSETSALSRAFRRWTGTSARQHRA